MEKIEREFVNEETIEFDDVLDNSYFAQKEEEMTDVDEDESNYEIRQIPYRPISEL